MKLNHTELEKKWQEVWLKEKTFSPDLATAQKPFYNLMMFPYPSAEGLHVGNMYAFTGADVYGRFQRMNGYDVLEPIGLDGFGIHSENYAIKVGRHPKEHSEISQKNFYKQLHMIGDSYDWERTLETYDPAYYKWTQWLFIKMFKKGLAYKDKALVNWCPSDKTVLSDEQVIDGKCERCGSEVTKREMSSWFFKITDYSDRLLENIEKINWPEKIKIAQRNWIGKSEGVEVNFKVKNTNKTITVFTTAHDTIFGTTFLVVAPEYLNNNLLKEIPKINLNNITKYIKESLSKSEETRKIDEKTKSGENTGLFAINPFNNKEVPIFVADYVLTNYGTGAVMGVPGHDVRDHEFAKKYKLLIVPVVRPIGNKDLNLIEDDGFWDYMQIKTQYSEMSDLFNSDLLNGLTSKEAKKIIETEVVKRKIGKKVKNYHLRDWGISRQRYWGPPIPMINCKDCGWQPVPEADLPVVLPDIKDFKPQGDGTSPLHNAPDSWKKVDCPNCGKGSVRELDVSDTFLDSSWYFLAYPNLGTKEWNGSTSPLNPEITKKWLPVNTYIGGAEHAVLHLLYARFVTMVLKDLKYIDFEEPFPFLFGHGLIIKDGAKMSKSKGNVVNPDEYINKFGADALRTYLMFLGAYDQGGDFRDSGIEGMKRFLGRVLNVFESDKKLSKEDLMAVCFKTHQTIKKVTSEISQFKYNTSIAAIMELVNMITEKGADNRILKVLVQLLAPFAPYMTEELWHTHFKKKDSIHLSSWPKYDTKYLEVDQITIIIQINGKMRGQVVIDKKNAGDKEMVMTLSKKEEKVAKHLMGVNIKKEIFVNGKLINFVTGK